MQTTNGDNTFIKTCTHTHTQALFLLQTGKSLKVKMDLRSQFGKQYSKPFNVPTYRRLIIIVYWNSKECFRMMELDALNSVYHVCCGIDRRFVLIAIYEFYYRPRLVALKTANCLGKQQMLVTITNDYTAYITIRGL